MRPLSELTAPLPAGVSFHPDSEKETPRGKAAKPKATAKVAPAPPIKGGGYLRENTQWGPSGGNQAPDPKPKPSRGKGAAPPPPPERAESVRIEE